MMVTSSNERKRLKSIAERLEKWFSKNGRDFPWREESASEYERICVEVLLQQTKAEAVSAYYETFFKRYPRWEAINNSSVEELQDTLKPLGLWKRRAKALKGLASYVVKNNGEFPSKLSDLLQIVAVGHYIANAIKLFQHSEPAALLDANMARVLERYFHQRKLADIRYDPWLNDIGNYLVKNGNPKNINWAILDLGALICKIKNPKCKICPLSRGCSKNITL